tara:strand:+ start:138 stop:368 length:231 start_codon:yes stop_codon:yes gene_type:complete
MNKQELRLQLAEDTKRFLANGGEIRHIPSGVSAHDYQCEKTNSGYIKLVYSQNEKKKFRSGKFDNMRLLQQTDSPL